MPNEHRSRSLMDRLSECEYLVERRECRDARLALDAAIHLITRMGARLEHAHHQNIKDEASRWIYSVTAPQDPATGPDPLNRERIME